MAISISMSALNATTNKFVIFRHQICLYLYILYVCNNEHWLCKNSYAIWRQAIIYMWDAERQTLKSKEFSVLTKLLTLTQVKAWKMNLLYWPLAFWTIKPIWMDNVCVCVRMRVFVPHSHLPPLCLVSFIQPLNCLSWLQTIFFLDRIQTNSKLSN